MKKVAIQALIERIEEEITGLEDHRGELEQAVRAAGDQESLKEDEFELVDLVLSTVRDELRAAAEARNKRAAVLQIIARQQAYLNKWAAGVPESNPRRHLIELGLSWSKKVVGWIEQEVNAVGTARVTQQSQYGTS